MKKFTGNVAVKIAAVVLSFLVFVSTVVSVLGCAVMLFNDFYTLDFSELEKSTMNTLLKNESNNLINKYQDGESYLQEYYKDKNVLYDIYNTYDGTAVSNYTGQKYKAVYTGRSSVIRYVDCNGASYNGDNVYYTQNDKIYFGYGSLTDVELYEAEQEIEFNIYIPEKMQFTDRFFLVDKLITLGFNNRYLLIFTSIISLLLCITVYSYLFISVGNVGDNGAIKVSPFNNIPMDLFSAFVFFVFLIGFIMIDSELGTIVPFILISVFVVTVLYFIALWYLLSLVVQIKAKSFIKRTVIFWFFKQLCKAAKLLKHVYKNFTTVYKFALVISVYWLLILIFIACNAYENDNLIIGWLLTGGAASIVLLLAAVSFQRVKQGGEKIVNGDLENKIDTAYMFGDIKDFAQSLNNINQGLQSAIDDKIKSERFKTELITNVSHDIKTPLTSIVNYVDLIQKEECDNEKINEYIEVLDRQSNRLKKLIEDLVEASKASTGNIAVELTKCNFKLLIDQAIGEFSQKLDAKQLQTVLSVTEEDVYIMADGRRLWRVLDNLLNNICKYAMPVTRVYIELKTVENKAILTFKNISEQPLNVSADELTERFVRGDRSRNTEGSGLGLSIAKSLTELQNGVFEIQTDGDLFKAKIVFDVIK